MLSLTPPESAKVKLRARALRQNGGLLMAPPNFAMQTRLVARSHQRNVVPLDDRRRRLPTGEPYPRGVVVRLPLPAGSRALEAERPARDSSGDRLTPIDYIAVILLFLSTLTGPVLVWALVSF